MSNSTDTYANVIAAREIGGILAKFESSVRLEEFGLAEVSCNVILFGF